MHGLKVIDNKVVHSILDDIMPVPDYMEFKPDSTYTKIDLARKTEWWNQYAQQFTGVPDVNTNLIVANNLYKNWDTSASVKEIIAFPDTIKQDLGGSRDKAVGITNWLGGGGLYKNWLGTKPAWVDPSYYLKTCNITTEGTVQPWSLSDLLEQLKKSNPAAHEYILRKAFAKACNVKLADDSGYSFTNNPTVNKVANSAADLASKVAGIPKIIMDSASNSIKVAEESVGLMGFLIEYWKPITAAVVLGGGYLAWKNRNELAKLSGIAARAAATKGQ
jgi:hypothetical protein